MGDCGSSSGEARNSAHEGLVASLVTPPDELAHRHFVLQGRRPAHLGDISLTELEPLLRGLLFTDGTVTRTLEVQALSRVSVEVVDQVDTTVNGQIASHLEVPSDTEAVRRRVLIGTRESMPVIWAESHILPSRMPPRFLRVLQGAPDGIGESLQRVGLESWRDLLWFGLDSRPKWSCMDASTHSLAITRVYRVITGSRPALLISESFSVGYRDGAYRLSNVHPGSD